MRYRPFGNTGKKVSSLGFGGMRFDPDNEELAIRTVRRAVELGINYFDTAPGYCEDRSEDFVGKALASLPEKRARNLYVSTKSHIRSDPTADDVRRRIEIQLRRLCRERISFYHMWCILDLDHFRAVMAPGGPYEGALRAKKEGLIEHICASTHASGQDIASMIRAGVFEGITMGYNLLNHEYRKEALLAAAETGCPVVAMNPLGGGMLTRDEKRFRVLEEGTSDSFIAAALRFVFSHREVTVVLSGMKNIQEVEANVNTAESVTGPDPAAIQHLLQRFESLGEQFCTTCGYCLEPCPEGIQIHLYMSLWDRVRLKLPEEARRVYEIYLKDEERWLKGKRAADCSECGACEDACTQHLPIQESLKKIAAFLGEKTRPR
ncbi:MAG: aldo/keto reductase, partial [Candidatus Aminicenantales bacterium]